MAQTDPRKLISCIWILCVVLGTSALVRAEHLPIKIYTTADGLWSSSISYLMRDSHGFIWFCTRDGLSRFDGYRFTNYKLSGDPAQSNLTYILETRKGVYWILTNDGQLYRFDPGTSGTLATNSSNDDGRALLNAPLIANKSILTLFEDHEGHLWAGADELLRVEDNNGQVSFQAVDLSLPPEVKTGFGISSIVEGLDGSLWLGTSKGLMRRFPDGRVEQLTILNDAKLDSVKTLLADKDGRIWIGHNLGIYILMPGAPAPSLRSPFTSRPLNARQPITSDGSVFLPNAAEEAIDCTSVEELNASAHGKQMSSSNIKIWSIFQSHDGRVWIGTYQSLVAFDGQRFQRYTAENGVTSTYLAPLAEDFDGDLWVASLNGPTRISAQGLTSYTEADGLQDPQVHSIYEGRDGKLYVVNGAWYVSRLDDRRFSTVRPNIPPDAKLVWTSNIALLDHVGAWWLLSSDGLYRFGELSDFRELAHSQAFTVNARTAGFGRDGLYCLFEDSRGDVWISTRASDPSQNVLMRWQRSTSSYHTYSELDGMPLKSASSFAEDRAGNLWFGFYQGGLARYTNGRFAEFGTEDGLPAGVITALHVDQAGRLWVTSSDSGLSRVDEPTAAHLSFIHYTTKEGLSSNNARSLTEDLQGRIYVGTLRGIDRLTPESGHIKHFGISDGLTSDWVKFAYRDRQGTLWFGTFNGLSRLDPQSDTPSPAPQIVIDGLNIAGVHQPLSIFGNTEVGKLELKSNQNNMQIDYSSLSLGHAASLRYQYKLEAADADWGAPTVQRSVTYANLKSGSYRFMVRAINADGLISQQPATFTFTVLPPIWARWWFLAVGVLVVIGSTYTLYRYRVRQLIELERVRTRIATDLHDDIGASLSRMAILSEVVKRQDEVKSGTSRRMLTEIADSARGLVDAMSDIVWSIDPQRDDLRSVSARIRQFASDVLEARGIKWELKLPHELETVKLNAEQRRQLLLIFKEALNNVVRHAECVNVTLSLALEGRALAAEVRDDGRGFQLEGTDQFSGNGRGGNGLKNMRARVAQLGGEISITSLPGQGTCLAFKVPLK